MAVNKKVSIICSTLALFCGAAAFASTSDPAQFVNEYYQAKSTAKSIFDTNNYLSARLLEKQKDGPDMKGMDKELLMMFMKSMVDQQPKKVHIDKSTVTPQKVTFELSAVQMPQHFVDMGKGATSSSLKGSLILVKQGADWKVDKDMWTFSAVNKDGKFSESSGMSGPDDKKKDLDDAPKSGGMDNSFDSQVRDKLMKAWKGSGKGKSIYAVIALESDGKIADIKVGGEKPQPEAEKQVADAITSLNPFQPLPDEYKSKRNLWMMFDWSDDSKAVSGPYFSEDGPPSWVKEKVGQATEHKKD